MSACISACVQKGHLGIKHGLCAVCASDQYLKRLAEIPSDAANQEVAVKLAAVMTLEHVWLYVRGYSPTLEQLERWLDEQTRRV